MIKRTIIRFLVFVSMLSLVATYSDPTSCTGSTKFYDILLLQCTTCPTNTVRASDFTYCNCSNSYYKNPDVIGFNNANSCLSLGVIFERFSHHIVVPVKSLVFTTLMVLLIPLHLLHHVQIRILIP